METGGSGMSAGGAAGVGTVPGQGGAAAAPGGGGAAAGASGSLGATPPMGWNRWNKFGCNLHEAMVKAMADTLVSSGMRAAGYEYVNLDDCWMKGRDSSGKLQWNATTFPSGIPALAR